MRELLLKKEVIMNYLNLKDSTNSFIKITMLMEQLEQLSKLLYLNIYQIFMKKKYLPINLSMPGTTRAFGCGFYYLFLL